MDFEANITKRHSVMWALVKKLKTQKAAAKALGCSKQRFNYLLNYASHLPLEDYLKMKHLLTEEELAEISMTNLLISERVQLAMQFESQNQPKKGRPKMNSSAENPQGRIAEIAAKEFKFSSVDNYLRAKKVVLKGTSELIAAMDQEKISIHQAAYLSEYSEDQQIQLLDKSNQERLNFIKDQKSIQRKAKTRCLDLSLYSHAVLLEAEKIHQLPLRILFSSLMEYCDEYGCFIWDPEKLKAHIAPYVNLDFSELLEVLCHWGLIQKEVVAQALFGRILIFNQFIYWKK